MKFAPIVLAAAFVLSSASAFADPVRHDVSEGDAAAMSSSTETQNPGTLHAGDLVRVRSGGPLMTVSQIQGDQVVCDWTENGEMRSGRFPVAVLASRLTAPPDFNADRDERTVDQYYQKHCPSGWLSYTGKFACAY